jgi:type II secretory pathway component PulC
MGNILERVRNIAVVLFCVALGAVIIAFIRRSPVDPAVALETPEAPSVSEAAPDSVIADAGMYESFAQQLAARDIFSSSPQASAFVPSAGTSELPANLKVVGIVVGTPSEVIIEDTSARQTYFIIQGQSEAGITLESIKDGQVLLSYQGNRVVVKIKDPRANF